LKNYTSHAFKYYIKKIVLQGQGPACPPPSRLIPPLHRRQTRKNHDVKFPINKIFRDEIRKISIKKNLKQTDSNKKNENQI